MIIAETERLRLRELVLADAPFILKLVNDPDWLRFVGDRNVRDEADARRYLQAGPLAMYAQRGFGLWLVERRADGVPLGICGLIARDTLPEVDLGFALSPEYRGRGLAREAAQASLSHARRALGLCRVLAITTLDNHVSAALLERLGFRFERSVFLPGDPTELRLFGIALERDG